jgi:hypothetical protein
MAQDPESAAERQAREEHAERVRHAFRNNPEFLRLLEASQEDEREGRYVSLDDVIRQHPPAD